MGSNLFLPSHRTDTKIHMKKNLWYNRYKIEQNFSLFSYIAALKVTNSSVQLNYNKNVHLVPK